MTPNQDDTLSPPFLLRVTMFYKPMDLSLDWRNAVFVPDKINFKSRQPVLRAFRSMLVDDSLLGFSGISVFVIEHGMRQRFQKVCEDYILTAFGYAFLTKIFLSYE